MPELHLSSMVSVLCHLARLLPVVRLASEMRLLRREERVSTEKAAKLGLGRGEAICDVPCGAYTRQIEMRDEAAKRMTYQYMARQILQRSRDISETKSRQGKRPDLRRSRICWSGSETSATPALR